MNLNCHVTFTCVNKIEVMYESLRVNVKVEPRSTFMFIRCLSLERTRVTFRDNGKREFVPRDHFSLNLRFTVHFLYLKISGFTLVLSITIFLNCF